MKTRFSAALSLILMLTPLSLLAASRYSQTVKFPDSVTVGGTQVPAGTYRVQWDGTGTVTASIVQGKKVVATAPANVVQTKTGFNGAIQTDGKDLQGILWPSLSIEFAHAPTASSASGN